MNPLNKKGVNWNDASRQMFAKCRLYWGNNFQHTSLIYPFSFFERTICEKAFYLFKNYKKFFAGDGFHVDPAGHTTSNRILSIFTRGDDLR